MVDGERPPEGSWARLDFEGTHPQTPLRVKTYLYEAGENPKPILNGAVARPLSGDGSQALGPRGSCSRTAPHTLSLTWDETGRLGFNTGSQANAQILQGESSSSLPTRRGSLLPAPTWKAGCSLSAHPWFLASPLLCSDCTALPFITGSLTVRASPSGCQPPSLTVAEQGRVWTKADGCWTKLLLLCQALLGHSEG